MAESNDWTAIEQKIQNIAATSSQPFEKDTIFQATELLQRLRDGYAFPEVGRGYWPTICFSWDTHPPVQIEVFADRFEFYRFHEGRSDIQSFEHTLGKPIPPDLLMEISTA